MTSPFVRLRPSGDAGVRLFCFPYAGGGAAVFRDWPAALPPQVEPVAVRLPGRESRFAEKPYDRMEPLVAHLLEESPGWLDRPYACFGYSMGARVALALTQELRRCDLPGPAALFVGGNARPSVPTAIPGWNDTDEKLIEHLRALGGIPPEVLAEPDLLALTLPTIRADLTVIATWRPRPEPVAAPIHAFAGTKDGYAPPDAMLAWAHQTAGTFRLTAVPGGHFFLHTEPRSVLEAVLADLAPLVGA
jgi:surfactin synthase thioesterase subunit